MEIEEKEIILVNMKLQQTYRPAGQMENEEKKITLVNKELKQSYQEARRMESEGGKVTYKSGLLENVGSFEIPKTNQCDFRKMTKINSKLNKRPAKCLQARPKQTESKNEILEK